MQLWRFVLDADNERDLANPDTAFDWFTGQTAWIPPGVALPARGLFVHPEWRLLVWSLRSLARRLKGARPKRETPSSPEMIEQADLTFRRFLGYLRLDVAADGPEPLTRKTFVFRVWPTTTGGEIATSRYPFRDLKTFWQVVFYSLVAESFEPVCESCGRPLGQTKTGRVSRRGKCRPCTKRAWVNRLSPKTRQAMWKRDKKRQRG